MINMFIEVLVIMYNDKYVEVLAIMYNDKYVEVLAIMYMFSKYVHYSQWLLLWLQTFRVCLNIMLHLFMSSTYRSHEHYQRYIILHEELFYQIIHC